MKVAIYSRIIEETERGEVQQLLDELQLLIEQKRRELKGGEIHGDMRPRSASRLAILPNTTHVTLMDRMPVIVPMVNDFLDAKPQKQ